LSVRLLSIALVTVVASAVVVAGCSAPKPVQALSPKASPRVTTASSLAPTIRLGRVASTTSRNWSGYCVTGRRFKSVSATWIQPPVSLKGKPWRGVDVWVGLDGWNGPTVEQVGTEADCQGGQTSWTDSYGWFEMYPQDPVDVVWAHVSVGKARMEIGPGDTISATVVRLGPRRFRLTLVDLTKGERFWTVQSSAAAHCASAEIIVETPDKNGEELAAFKPIRFSKCTVDRRPLGAFVSKRVAVFSGGRQLTGASALNADGSGFSVARE